MMSRNAVAVAWALHARGLSPAAWKVLMVLAHRVNNRRGDWDVWPKQQRLADDCELSLPTLKRRLDELEDKGFLRRTTRHRKSGGISGCTYSLAVVAVFEMPDGKVSHSFEHEDPDEEDTLAQDELARSLNGELARSLTAELAIEPLNPEPLNPEDSPLSLTGEAPPHENYELAIEGDSPPTTEAFVLTEWARLKADFPNVTGIRKLDDARKKKIRARVRAALVDGQTEIDVWAIIFRSIRADRFLRGEVTGRQHDRPFSIDIDFVLRPARFMQILEKAENNEQHQQATHDPRTGRRYGPVEQSGRNVLASLLARPQRGRDA